MRWRLNVAVWLLLFLTPSTLMAEPEVPPAVLSADSSDQDLADVLSTYVDEQGAVDYRGLKAHREKLDRFLDRLFRMDPTDYGAWPNERKIAFWLNAYNAYVLHIITENYPIKPSLLISLIHPKNSIRQIAGVFDQLQVRVLGKDMTLDEIEHKILRREFNEPRIHMALVCAAKGCPSLRKEPYVASRLNDQLNDQTRPFLASPKKFRIDRENGRVYLSFIFKWFGEDFARVFAVTRAFAGANHAERSVLYFISHFLGAADRKFLEEGRYTVEYLDYDWALNEQAQADPKSSGM